jgi:hypothetical protein
MLGELRRKFNALEQGIIGIFQGISFFRGRW